MYCDAVRLVPMEGRVFFMLDTAMKKPIPTKSVDELKDICYNPNLAPGPDDKMKITTRVSDIYDASGHQDCKGS